MTNARASWNVISTQSVYLYNCPLFEATRAKYLLSDEKTAHSCTHACIVSSWIGPKIPNLF